MKRVSLFFLLFLCVHYAFSQKDSAKSLLVLKPAVSNQLRVIPPAKAATIRKDVLSLRLQLSEFSDSVALVKKDIDASIDKMKRDIDGMSEMGEMENLRLQMAMDRMSKMMSTLSNLMKKMSETSQGITQNLK
jgi:hypothetical protein